MANLNQDLETLKTARDNMKTALEVKGQTVSKDIRTYADAISNISGGDVKLFDTVEHMQADSTAQEGDMAIVYYNNVVTYNPGDTLNNVTFPKTVTFDTAITATATLTIRKTSGTSRIQATCRLTATAFTIQDMYESIPMITYSSSDGLVYVRTDNYADTYNFGGVTVSSTADANILKFFIYNNIGFDGLYQYKGSYDKSNIIFSLLSDVSISGNTRTYTRTSTKSISYNKLLSILSKINDDTGNMFGTIYAFINNDNVYIVKNTTTQAFYQDDFVFDYDLDNNKWVFIQRWGNAQYTMHLYAVDLDNRTYVESTVTPYLSITPSNHEDYFEVPIDTFPILINYNSSTVKINSLESTYGYVSNPNSGTAYTEGSEIINFNSIPYNYTYTYSLMKTQFTATPDKVFNSIYYGINGVEEGALNNTLCNTAEDIKNKSIVFSALSNLDTSNITRLKGAFSDCTELITMPNFDTSNVTDMASMFSQCYNLVSVPNYNTINVTNMRMAFYSCRNLTSIPNFDTSNVTNFAYAFSYCNNVTQLPNFNLTKATNVANMFKNLSKVTSIPAYDTSNVADMEAMLDGMNLLTQMPNFNTINVTNLTSTFKGWSNLTTALNYNTSNLVRMTDVFYSCTNLVSMPQWNTAKVNSMVRAFYACNNLSNTSIQNIINMVLNSNVTNANWMNLSNSNSYSPLYWTKFNNSYYSNRLSELSAAGWSY